MKYIRTCQSCGNEQVMKDPDTIKDPKENWKNAKCRKCKSEDLDFGSWRPETKEEIERAQKFMDNWE